MFRRANTELRPAPVQRMERFWVGTTEATKSKTTTSPSGRAAVRAVTCHVAHSATFKATNFWALSFSMAMLITVPALHDLFGMLLRPLTEHKQHK